MTTPYENATSGARAREEIVRMLAAEPLAQPPSLLRSRVDGAGRPPGLDRGEQRASGLGEGADDRGAMRPDVLRACLHAVHASARWEDGGGIGQRAEPSARA